MSSVFLPSAAGIREKDASSQVFIMQKDQREMGNGRWETIRIAAPESAAGEGWRFLMR